MTAKLVACVVIPHLLTWIARQQEALTAMHPLAIATATIDRAIIIDSCPRAAALGVQVGMSACVARQHCPSLQVTIVPEPAAEHAATSIEQVLAQHADVVERHALGCWMLDLVALGRQFRDAATVAQQIQQDVQEATGWPCAVGLGAQRIVARIAARTASERDSSGRIVILPGAEAAFLAPLPVRLLPGIGERTEGLLARLGITTIGQLAALPERVLLQLVGPRGRVLRLHARGLDAEHTHAARQLLTSRWYFQRTPCADEQHLRSCVYRLTGRVGRRLRAKTLAAGEITVRLHWIDGMQRQARTRFAVRCDLDHQLAQGSHAALQQLVDERRLAVTSVEVAVSDTGPLQQTLFQLDDRTRQRQIALDQIKHRHGTSAILLAWLLPTRRP